jgi:hypothetical protein
MLAFNAGGYNPYFNDRSGPIEKQEKQENTKNSLWEDRYRWDEDE